MAGSNGAGGVCLRRLRSGDRRFCGGRLRGGGSVVRDRRFNSFRNAGFFRGRAAVRGSAGGAAAGESSPEGIGSPGRFAVNISSSRFTPFSTSASLLHPVRNKSKKTAAAILKFFIVPPPEFLRRGRAPPWRDMGCLLSCVGIICRETRVLFFTLSKERILFGENFVNSYFA